MCGASWQAEVINRQLQCGRFQKIEFCRLKITASDRRILVRWIYLDRVIFRGRAFSNHFWKEALVVFASIWPVIKASYGASKGAVASHCHSCTSKSGRIRHLLVFTKLGVWSLFLPSKGTSWPRATMVPHRKPQVSSICSGIAAGPEHGLLIFWVRRGCGGDGPQPSRTLWSLLRISFPGSTDY